MPLSKKCDPQAAVCSARIVMSSVCVGDDDNRPVGGWWKSRRPSFFTSPATSDRAPYASAARKRQHRCQMCCVGADYEESGLRRRNCNRQVDILRYPLLNSQREDNDYETKWFEEDPSQSLARQLATDANLRERAVRLGGAYVCSQLVEVAVCLARENFQDFEDTISKLTQVCTDAKPGWRHRRVRFNRTVGMLLEAGKARAQIARMREYYEQAHLVARSAAGLWTSSNAVSRSLNKGAAESKTAQWRIFADIHSELEPWLRHVQNLAYGDLRRLHQQDNLLHSYVVLARLRHEDDYNRITVLLSLVATIFLPLSFVTGVFGMNFTKLPLRSYQWSFVAFIGLSVSIILVALFSFWYRGWLNVVKSTGIYRRRDFAESRLLV